MKTRHEVLSKAREIQADLATAMGHGRDVDTSHLLKEFNRLMKLVERFNEVNVEPAELYRCSFNELVNSR